jgi:hypothetical protein
MGAMSTKIPTNKPRTTNRARQPAAFQPPSHDEIAGRAKALWERYGKPVGRDEEIWLEAEREARRIAHPTPASLTRAPLKEDPEKLESAVERIQEMADPPRGTQQVIR